MQTVLVISRGHAFVRATSVALAALLVVLPALAKAQARVPAPTAAQAQPPRVATVATRCDSVELRRSANALDVGLERILLALSTIETQTRRVLQITGLRPAQLAFVDTRQMPRGAASLSLEQAIRQNERKITHMRSELQSSMILRDALVERHIPMSQVIAVDLSSDASLATIYYRPQE